MDKLPQPEPVYITGDFNVRFQAQHPNDAGVTGPFTSGKGRRHIDHTASSNRSLCVKTMTLLDMLEVASYKTPNPTHQITYKDKTAPPTDWGQFLLDPLILQQIYSKIHNEASTADQALSISSHIRSFFDLPEPLPPSQNTPHPEPTRYQRLDHLFTRRQWLPSINSCRSKLYTGFPSDHYLLVTEVQINVKLAQRKQFPKYVPKLDFSKVDQTLRDRFNRTIQGQQLNEMETASDHTARITFFTDGSGSKGRCTRSTPAGWGWCAPQGNDWLDASGPVTTDPNHLKFIGAQVGSNTTGELSAIIEALLFALEHEYSQVVIHSDSQWAIHMIKGIWRPKSNKDLVSLAQKLAYNSGLTTHFQCVKGHSGVQGNERADVLANQGRDSQTCFGGRTIPLPIQTTPPSTAFTTDSISDFVSCIDQAARQHFPLKQRNPPKPWISEETLRALDSARQAQATLAPGWKQERNKAKRMARRDRIAWIHHQLQEDPGAVSSTVWNAIRRQRKGFQGRRSHLVSDGKPVPWSKTHEAFRDHLQAKQWAKPTIPDHTAEIRRSRQPLRPTQADEPPFTMQELSAALAKTKTGKAPGPDGLVNEILQLLDKHGKTRLLTFYNQSWLQGTIPSSWSHATVVSIFKGKGDDTDPSSYRPISLLNATYKVYAAMIQTRLATSFDNKLRNTQSGFRAGRGTRHPLFTLRRAMEWAEMTNHNLYCLFLDWKQAFDSIDHTAMLEALRRFGLSEKMISTIQAIYSSPTFQTKGPEGTVSLGEVHSGIRQGCPLSPYLFTIVLTVIFYDLDGELLKRGVATNTWSQGYPVYDLEYADDTLLMAITIEQLQSILHTLEDVASEYGMQLNLIKTELLYIPDHTATLRFKKGSLVPRKEVVKYLGSLISWKKPFETAFRQRASLAEEAYKKLRLVWNSSRPKPPLLFP